MRFNGFLRIFVFFVVVVVMMDSKSNTTHKTTLIFPLNVERKALSERSERLYAFRVSECEHMQICFFERSEKMLGSKFAPIRIHAQKERVLNNKSSKIKIFDLPYVFFDE